MPEIKPIQIPEIRALLDIPAPAIPQAPPVTIEIGRPVVDVPSFNAIDYEPEVRTTSPRPPRASEEQEKPAKRHIPPAPTAEPATEPLADCPPPGAPGVGTVTADGRQIVSGYQLQAMACVTQYEDLPVLQQVAKALPTTAQVTTTTSVAFIAASATLATPFVLKLIKPAVKKILTKIIRLFGRKGPRLSVSDRRRQQRESRS